jgi:type II secretory pathway pseudopilin PulG
MRPLISTEDKVQQRGFSLIELMIAGLIMMVAISGLALLFGKTVVLTGSSRQEQAASQLMTRAMEQIRALPFQKIADGHLASDLNPATDNLITNVSGVLKFNGQDLKHSASLSYTQEPIIPHSVDSTTNPSLLLNNTRYRIRTYITKVTPVTTPEAYRVTVVVSWPKPSSPGGIDRVTGETIVYSPDGCTSSTNHPFAAPCQPFFYGNATTGLGGITLTPGAVFTEGIDELDLKRAQLLMPELLTGVQVEQISSVFGKVAAGGGTFETNGSSGPQTVGETSTAAAADNDPSSTAARSTSGSVAQTATTQSFTTGAGNYLRITSPSTAASGALTSTALAQATPACNLLTGVALTNDQPCGSGALTQSTATPYSMTMRIWGRNERVGDTRLAEIVPSTATNRVHVSRYIPAGAVYCTTSSGDGCVRSAAQRGFGRVSIGGLPDLFSLPTGWNATDDLVSINNYADSANAESGVGAIAPVTTQSGTVKYWNGTGYSTVTLPLSTNFDLPIPDVIRDVTLSGTTFRVYINANLRIVPPATQVDTASCTVLCTAKASVPSPVVGDIVYQLIADPAHDNELLADVVIGVDLGALTASTTYKKAPLAGS